eukprot:1156783-Pelagomonas_calceolata.AAC.2
MGRGDVIVECLTAHVMTTCGIVIMGRGDVIVKCLTAHVMTACGIVIMWDVIMGKGDVIVECLTAHVMTACGIVIMWDVIMGRGDVIVECLTAHVMTACGIVIVWNVIMGRVWEDGGRMGDVTKQDPLLEQTPCSCNQVILLQVAKLVLLKQHAAVSNQSYCRLPCQSCSSNVQLCLIYLAAIYQASLAQATCGCV